MPASEAPETDAKTLEEAGVDSDSELEGDGQDLAPSKAATAQQERQPGAAAPPTEDEPPDSPRISRRIPKSSLLRDQAFLDDDGSDSSEDERPARNTVGDVPLEWYKNEEHIGYDR